MPSATPARRLPRSFFARQPEVVARELLGSVISTGRGPERVSVRLTETEAYLGESDPASHAFRGRTPRNAVMFGPAGHLYLYFVYGMHWCANIVTGQPGSAGAVLLRAGEVVEGGELAELRRPSARRTSDLAAGPARLATVLGWGDPAVARATNGADLCTRSLALPRVTTGGVANEVVIAVGPRVGVATAKHDPLRFWMVGDPTVSAYREAVVRTPRSREPLPG